MCCCLCAACAALFAGAGALGGVGRIAAGLLLLRSPLLCLEPTGVGTGVGTQESGDGHLQERESTSSSMCASGKNKVVGILQLLG